MRTGGWSGTHGTDLFVRGDRAPASLSLPDELRPFPGHYRSSNPWNPSIRILERGGALWLVVPVGADGELELQPLDDGTFQVGTEPWRPDRVSFDMVVDGRAARMHYDGAPYHRSFMP